MPDYFNVKPSTYNTQNRMVTFLPLVSLLFIRPKAGINQPLIAASSSTNNEGEPNIANNSTSAPNTRQHHSLLSSLGSAFSGSNALDILSSVEPFLASNHQQLISAIKGLNNSLSSLKNINTTPATTSNNNTNSLDVVKALSNNFAPDVKNSVNPILNLLSTVQTVQSAAPTIKNILSPSGIKNALSMLSGFSGGNVANTANGMNLEGLSDLLTTLSSMSTQPQPDYFKTDQASSTDSSNETLYEVETNDDTESSSDIITDVDYKPIEESNTSLPNAESISEMAEKLKSLLSQTNTLS